MNASNIESDTDLRDTAEQIVGTLYHGSPWVSGPLVGPSCLTAQTEACGTLRGNLSGIGDQGSGPLEQGRDGLQGANCDDGFKPSRTQEIHHDQNQTLRYLRGLGRFLPAARHTAFSCRHLPEIDPHNAKLGAASVHRPDSNAGSMDLNPSCSQASGDESGSMRA